MSTTPSLETLRSKANTYLESYNYLLAKAGLFSRQLRRIIQDNLTRSEAEREALTEVNSLLESAIAERNQSVLTILGSYFLTLKAYRDAGGVARDYEYIPPLPAPPILQAESHTAAPAKSHTAAPAKPARRNPLGIEPNTAIKKSS
jgi:hypothetical protein